MRMRCRERPRSRETSLTRWPVEGNAFLSWFVPVLGCIAKRVGITMISSQFHLQPQQEDCSHWINSLCLLQIVIFIKETTVAWCNQHSTCKTHKKVKRTPLNWTKRDKTCTFSRKASCFKLRTIKRSLYSLVCFGSFFFSFFSQNDGSQPCFIFLILRLDT